MATVQRGLIQLIEDLDRRARPDRPPRNQPLQKYVSVNDVVVFSSDTQTSYVLAPPLQWATASATDKTLTWSLGEWR